MRKYLPSVLMIGLLVLAGVSFFYEQDVILALLFAVLGVLVWASLPSVLGNVPVNGGSVDGESVKEYRRNHRGATIGDAIRETRE